MSKIRLVLTGPLKGKTFSPRPEYQYVDGVMELEGTPLQNEGIIKYHAICYQAVVEGGAIDFDGHRNTVISVVLKPRGSMAGKTFTANGYQFVNGELPLTGPVSEIEGVMKYMKTCYQAYPVDPNEEKANGKCDVQEKEVVNEQPEVQPEVQSDEGADPEGEAVESEGRSESEAGDARVRAEGDGDSSRLAQVVKALDHGNETHWTKGGKPSVFTVRAYMDDESVTREDIDAAVPGHVREE